MDVIFLSDNPVNSKVIEQVDGTHVYDISTLRTPDSRDVYSTTTVRRPSGEVVALWDWSAHNRKQDRITYLGGVHTLADWLTKESVFSTTRLNVPYDGKNYRWKQPRVSTGSRTLELTESDTGRVIAGAGHVHTGSGFERERKMKLAVQPEATGMVDVVVLSFIVLEELRRERGMAASSASWVGAWNVAPSIT